MSQHTKPCRTCPFSKACTPGELGGSSAETFIGQAFGSFWLPCHECVDYSNPNWKTQYDVNQCAGAAAARSMWFPAERNKSLIALPPHDAVFSSPADFLAHHHGITVTDAKISLSLLPPGLMWLREMQKPQAKIINQVQRK